MSAPTPRATAPAAPVVPRAVADETPAAPAESAFEDWRERLGRNLSRRSVGRWEPLTYGTGEGSER